MCYETLILEETWKDATCVCLAFLSQSIWRGEERCNRDHRETQHFQRAASLEMVPRAAPEATVLIFKSERRNALHKPKSHAAGLQLLLHTLSGEAYLD